MQAGSKWHWTMGFSAALFIAGCGGSQTATAQAGASHSTTTTTTAQTTAAQATVAATHGASAMTSAYDKPGFHTSVEDGRLWVLRGGEEKNDKHVTLIGAGPAGMTIKAASKDTALAYIVAKTGFVTEVHDGRIHVMRGGEKWSDKHITLIGAGPRGMTVKALDKETAWDYLTAKDGFITHIEDGRLHVMREGESWSDKHITLIGAGPNGMTIKALEKDTAYAYLAAKPGFVTHVEDGRVHVMRPGESWSDKHVTLIGAGPKGMTVKALDRGTAMAYLAAN